MPKGNANRIDVHSHMIPEFYREAAIAAGAVPAQGRYPSWSPELALQMMQENEIRTILTSIAYPAFNFGSLREAATLARRCNEYAAEIGVKWPGRFGGLASLPIQDPFSLDSALVELDYAMGTLGTDGVMLFASYAEKFLGDPVYEPLMAALNQRRCAVLIHPTYTASAKKIDLPYPGFMIEYLFDTTRAAVNLLFTDSLTRYPDIKFILAHAGGTIPYVSWRLAITPTIDRTMPQWSSEEIHQKLKRFWYDTALSPSFATMGSLLHVADPTKVLFATDWPMSGAVGTTESVKCISAPGLLSEQQQADINRGNALKLFPKYVL